MLLVVVLVLAVLAGVALTQDGPTSPADRLRAIQAFVREATSVRFEAIHETDDGSGFPPQPASTYRTEGSLALPDRARWVQRDGDNSTETLQTREGSYVRYAQPRQGLDGGTWVYARHEPPADPEGGAPGTGIDPTALIAALGGPPLDVTPGRAGLARVIGALRDPEEAGDGRLRTTLPLAALFATDALADAAAVVRGSVTVELTSGPGGRLDAMAWKLDARLRGSVGASVPDDVEGARYGRFAHRAEVDFRGWNRPVDVAAPDIDDVDITPSIDEEGLAAVSGVQVLAPTEVPPGWLLTGADDSAIEGRTGGFCSGVDLYYSPRPRPGAAPRSPLAPGLHLVMTDASCDDAYEVGPPLRPFVAGDHRGAVHVEGVEGGTNWLVILVVGGTRVLVDSNLSEPALVTTLASLAPLDLATAPVLVSIPPS